jgi:NTP pyrophosphatase (non-canonical NTP hydrolase)
VNMRKSATEAKSVDAASIRAAFTQYQLTAAETSEFRVGGPLAPIAPMLGLAGEVGALLDAHKRYLREVISFKTNRELVREELGDLLWYIAAVATAAGLDLGDVVIENLERTRDLYPASNISELLKGLRRMDDGWPEHERFPDVISIYFDEQVIRGSPPVARLVLIAAEPNHFPDGTLENEEGKLVGFQVGKQLGAQLTDNSRTRDGYRYHDALHLAFAAVLGWSPTLRGLLNLKRRSNPQIDRDEDGARASFAEEGLTAALSRMAGKRMGLLEEQSVDGHVIEIAKALTTDTEAGTLPGWLWRRAVSQGFSAMKALDDNQGGCLTADLRARAVTYSKTPPVSL